MRILTVDDDPIILELIREIIGLSDDQELLTAGSGPEALKLLDDPATPMIDCFLLDIQMPVMDGIDLCTALRKRPEFRTTPVVMLTAMTEKRYVDAAFIAGATDYITKPFDIGDMQRRLRTAALRRSEMARFETDASAAVAQGQRRELLAEVPIYDVDNVIDYFSFENYARQLSKRSLFTSLAVAVHIRRIGDFHAACEPFMFESLLTDVAEATSDSLRDHSFVMSYAGNGSFICLIEDGHLPDRKTLVSRINLLLQQMQLDYGLDCPPCVQVCAGDYVRLVGRNSDGISEALVQAHASAESYGQAIDAQVDRIWYEGVVGQ